MLRKLFVALCTLALGLVGAVAVTVAPAQAVTLIQFKNSVNSYTSIYMYNPYTCGDGSPWILSVNETNWVNDCNGGLRLNRSFYSPRSYRLHYDGFWHPWHCDESYDPNPPNKSPMVIQVENDYRC
jgi:hypothetical protein